MIRPLTCVTMLLAAGSGLYLYQTKHRAQMLDREIVRTFRQIDQTKDRIGVLKGEWALLNEPDRLGELAQQHLSLKTLAPTQFVALADLGSRLPAPLPPGSVVVPLEDVAAPALAGPVGPSFGPAMPPVAAKPIVAAKQVAEKAAPERAVAEKPVQVASLQAPAGSASGAQAAAMVAPMPPTPPALVPPPAARAVPHASVSTSGPGPVAAVPTAAPKSSVPVASQTMPTPAIAPAPPRIMAPVMNVSAASIPARPAPARPATVHQDTGDAGRTAAGSAMPSVIPTSTGYGTAQGSVLGGVGRVALPAPVPFGATAPR